MLIIDTAQKGWQKKMSLRMKRNDKFLLRTSDQKLAKAIEDGKYNVGVLKIILCGSGVAATAAAGSTVMAV